MSDQRLECPDCGNQELTLTVRGRIGIEENIIVSCGDCHTLMLETIVKNETQAMTEQFEDMYD